MNSKKWIVATSALVAIAVTLCVLPLIAQAPAATTATVTNKTYDVWVSQSFATPPFTPFHDCATFTKTKMCLAQCGDCGPLSEVQIGTTSIWKGTVPCGGLNLVFTGTSISGPQANVIGASSVGGSEGTNFGLEGVQNQSCSLAAAAAGKSQYAKP
jgi:hypothetical protein